MGRRPTTRGSGPKTAAKALSLYPLSLEEALDELLAAPTEREAPAALRIGRGKVAPQGAQRQVMRTTAEIDSRYKLKQLILYIASRMKDAEFFGTTKLNKVMSRSEFAAFREIGHKLTSFHYQKNTRGPTLRAFQPITQEMVQEGSLTWERTALGERRPLTLQEPDLSAFSARELALVDAEIKTAWNLTAKEMSAEEHETAAWFATRMGETVRPELSFVEDPVVMISLSDAEQERAATAIEGYRIRAARSANPRPRG
jgi:Protein of unknown function (DUF4065)